jgi:hypothetical protein
MAYVERSINQLEKEGLVQWTSLVDWLVTCKLKVDLMSRKVIVNTLNKHSLKSVKEKLRLRMKS